MQKVYQQIATALDVMLRNNPNHVEFWSTRLKSIMRDAPSGSGFDSGTQLSEDSKPDRLIFCVEYHHMNDNGFYDGWTQHKVIVKPSLMHGLDMRVTGRDRNMIKDYIADVFSEWLTQAADYDG